VIERDLKTYLVKSIKAQGGEGTRLEDKFATGLPDLLLIPAPGPCFFAEVKLLSGRLLRCTTLQETWLDRLHREKRRGIWFSLGVILGYHAGDQMLYCGRPGEERKKSLWVSRPRRLDSSDWPISDLLFRYDQERD